jgi:isoquinoline 1-oxidoreductase beta subunit
MPDRRTFLTWSLQGALLLAVSPGRAQPAAAPPNDTLSPWIRIAPDGRVTLFTSASEMGQGARTGQAQVLADELDVAWEAVEVAMAPDADPFRSNGRLSSGGSRSLRSRFHQLREAGATARALLTLAAARRWDVEAETCEASLGQVTHPASGRSATYGALAAEAAALPPPEKPPLKPREAWRYIGRDVRPIGLVEKTRGAAEYGVDVRLPGLSRATIVQCPVFGGSLESVDPAPALAVPGVKRVVSLPAAVAVVADRTWAAFKGAAALRPRWTSPPDGFSSGDLAGRLAATLAAPDLEGPVPAGAPGLVEATYEVPFLAHAPMEPMNATVRVGPDKVEVWAPCQNITELRKEVARALDRPVEQVELTVTFLGGGFGRRLKSDYAVQAALIAQAHGGPVQLVWRREEDLTHDFYRPAARHRYRATPGADGVITGFSVSGAAANDQAADGADAAPYAIASLANLQREVKVGVPIGPWRSVDHSITGFGRESFIDECAHAAGRDPLDYRRALLGYNDRARRLLDATAEAIGWGKPRPAGRGVGLALIEGFDSLACHAVEVEVAGKSLAVKRLVVAGDCGTAVNPGQVRAQLEGGALMGLSAALGEAMTFTGGAAGRANFDSYRLLRMRQAPATRRSSWRLHAPRWAGWARSPCRASPRPSPTPSSPRVAGVSAPCRSRPPASRCSRSAGFQPALACGGMDQGQEAAGLEARAPDHPLATRLSFHLASTSASRSGVRPARSFACRSAGCCRNQARVSAAVPPRRRKVRPAAVALSMLRRANPAESPRAGTHTGMSLHGDTFWASRKSAGIQTSVSCALMAAPVTASMCSMVVGAAGPVALKTPEVRASAMRIVHSARSRASMSWIGSEPSPGASTSPPRASRTGQ